MIEYSEFIKKGNLHVIRVKNDVNEIKEKVVEPILKELIAYNYCEQDQFAVRLSLEEAIMNAYKHGNKADPTKSLDVKWSVDEKEVLISIKDEGEGFDPSKVPDPREEKNLLKPSGRGLLLIRAYMNEVSFNKKCNEIRMRKIKGNKSPIIQRLRNEG